MKTRILLIDESLTVQKVVALTLERSAYAVEFAINKKEAANRIMEGLPDLILVSDLVKDLVVSTFPKEMETWVGRTENLPSLILITSQDIKEMRNYSGVLRKPFAPHALKSMVAANVKAQTPHAVLPPNDFEEERLEKAFNNRFSDEARLVSETMGVAPKVPSVNVLSLEESVAYKASLENQIKDQLEGKDLDAVVDRLLDKILPPIVERLVHERLDSLLKEQEKGLESSR